MTERVLSLAVIAAVMVALPLRRWFPGSIRITHDEIHGWRVWYERDG